MKMNRSYRYKIVGFKECSLGNLTRSIFNVINKLCGEKPIRDDSLCPHCYNKLLSIKVENFKKGINNPGFKEIPGNWVYDTTVFACRICGHMEEINSGEFGSNRMSNTIYYLGDDILEFLKRQKQNGH